LLETANTKIQELNNEINSIIESQKQGYKLLKNLISMMEEYQTTNGNLPSKKDLENANKIIRNTSPKKLIETKSQEQREAIQAMDKKVQDTLNTLNSSVITEMNSNILQKMNQSIEEQKEAKENQVKIMNSYKEA
jgi:23S rRNA A1618 N6-methylase RlmF